VSTNRVEEYLEAIFKVAQLGKVSLTTLSKELKLSAPTVSEMLKRMAKNDLVTLKDGISLTRNGSRLAKKVIRRHRLSERLLTDILGLPWDKAHDEACKLEHVITGEVEDQLAKSLGNPKTCPHGHPIPSKDGKVKIEKTKKLDTLKSGDSAIIKLVFEDDPKMLKYLSSLGLLPDVKIKVKEVAPFGGPIIVKIGRSMYALGKTIASKIEVARV